MTTNSHPNVDRFARLARHIEELCRAFGVVLNVVPGLPPDAGGAGYMVGDTSRLAIQVAPVIDDSTYAVALHELGHCLSPLGMINHIHGSSTMRRTHRCSTLRDVRLQLDEECAAWDWARHYALEWTDLMTMVERYALMSYRREARRLGVKETP